jgi:hypothetical protein
MVRTRQSAKKGTANDASAGQPTTSASKKKSKETNIQSVESTEDPQEPPQKPNKKESPAKKKRKGNQVDTPSESDYDEDEDEPEPERRSASPSQFDKKLFALDLAWREYLAEHYVNRDAMLPITRKIFELLEHNSLRAAPPEPAVRDRLDRNWEALLLPPKQALTTITKANVQVVSKYNSWRIYMTFHNKRKIMVERQTFSARLPFTWFPKTERTTVQKVANEFANLINRWRWEPTLRLTSIFLVAAVNKVLDEDRKVCANPVFEPSANRLSVLVQLLDDGTNDISERRVHLGQALIPEDIDLDSIPEPAPGTRWGSTAENTEDQVSCRPEGDLPSGWTDKKFAAAEKFLRFFATEVYGRVASDKQKEELFNFHVKAVFGRKHQRGGEYPLFYCALVITNQSSGSAGVYGRHRLFNPSIFHARKSYILQPGRRVLADLGLSGETHQLVMLVRSTLASRAVAPLDFGYKSYTLDYSPRRAILSLAEAVDATNMNIAEGVPVDTSCMCTDAQSAREYHPCAVCLDPALCNTLTFNKYGVRVCPDCVEADPEVQKHLAEVYVVNQIKRLAKLEADKSGRDFQDEAHQRNLKECIEELLAGLPDQSEGPCYFEGFSDKEVVKIRQEIATSGRNIHPDTMSIDAQHLRVEVPGIGLVGHAPGNIHTTRDPVNRGKFVWPSAVLAIVSEWLRMPAGKRNAQELMRMMTNLQIITCKGPFYTAARNSETPDPETLKREQHEVIAGRPNPDEDGPWRKYSQRWVYGKVHPLTVDDEDTYTWPLKPRNGLIKVTAGCEKQFRVKLQRSPGGLPYVGLNTSSESNPQGSMEEGYDANSIAVFCQERRERMRIYCNRRHLTEDSSYSLYAEMIRSACVDQACINGKCPEPETHLFHLPKCLKVKHPLRLSVAHKHHSKQMIAGWPEEPSDVKQRQEEINNILMETWFENWSKLDLDEKFYELLRQIFRELVVPRKLYNPTATPPAGTNQSLAQASNVDVDAEVVTGPIANPNAENEGGDDGGAGGIAGLPGASTSGSGSGTSSLPGASTSGAGGTLGLPGASTSGSGGGAFDLPGASTSNPSAPVSTSVALLNNAGKSVGSTLTVELKDANYDLIAADGLVADDSVFYGKVLVVNGQTGYAHDDNTFRTTNGAIVGMYDAEANCYPLAGKFVPPPEPYTGDLKIGKMVYHQQLATLVDENSSFFDIVLVNGLEIPAFASTSGEFITEAGDVFGHFDIDTGNVTDPEELRVGNVGDVQGSSYLTVDEGLADLDRMVLTVYDHDAQVEKLTSTFPGVAAELETRIQGLLSEGSPLFGQALTTPFGDDMLIALAFEDHVFRNPANDDILAVIRDSGILDVNGNRLADDLAVAGDGDSGDEGGDGDGDGDGGQGSGNDGGNETGEHGGTEQPRLVAVRQDFSEERSELRNLVPPGTVMDGIVVHRRNDAGEVEVCYPSRLSQFLRPQTPGATESDYTRTVAVWGPVDDSNNFYVISDEEDNVIAHVKRKEKGQPWKLIQSRVNPSG